MKIKANLGGTELLEPLRSILSAPIKGRDRVVLLITDGAVQNLAEIMEFVKQHKRQNRIFSVGIGQGTEY